MRGVKTTPSPLFSSVLRRAPTWRAGLCSSGLSWGRIGVALAAAVLAAAVAAQPAATPVPLASSASAASEAAYRLRIVGGLAGLNQYTRQEEPFWARELARLSGGRFQADIVPFDRAGIPGSEMLRLLQLGVVPFGTTLMSSFTAQNPEYTAADLAGLNPDMASLRRTLAAFRPYLEQSLRQHHGVEVLAIYVYPAQVAFCKRPLARLADLAGRRIRVSSSTQADFMSALQAVPVLTGFAQVVPSLQAGNTECAITGTMSGNTLGLHELTTHVHAMPITWGLAVFGANGAAWRGLPQELRALLGRELPRLEAAIWEESERETAQGLACNQGLPSCTSGRRGRMAVVAASAQDEQVRRDILASTVLPRWVQRCGRKCAEIWNTTVGPVHGLKAHSAP